MAIEKLYTESKTTGSRLTAEEFNKLPEKIIGSANKVFCKK